MPVRYQDDVNLDDGYAQHPTATGSLDMCLACGVFVGDRELHSNTCANRIASQ